MSGVLLGLGGGRGRGGETEQGAEASRGGLRHPKLMGRHCGHRMVKNTCKYIQQKWKEEGERVEMGAERADPSGKDSKKEGDKERSRD